MNPIKHQLSAFSRIQTLARHPLNALEEFLMHFFTITNRAKNNATQNTNVLAKSEKCQILNGSKLRRNDRNPAIISLQPDRLRESNPRDVTPKTMTQCTKRKKQTAQIVT